MEALIFSTGGTFLRSLGWVLGNGFVVKDRMGGITISFDWVGTAFDSNIESWMNTLLSQGCCDCEKTDREKLALVQEIRGRNHVAKRRWFEPAYHRIKAKYKLIATSE